MINIPAALSAKVKSNDLTGLKCFARLYRNKWDAQQNAFKLEDTPLDITEQVVKWGTLSTKLDVGEINEFTASNMTLTLSDPENRFVEETPQSYFPAGYQIYGSRVDISCGTESEQTPLFSGVIKTLPNYTPEKYQLSLTLVSALELLDDVEAKDFSDAYPAEALILDHVDEDKDGRPYYRTAHYGVGGISAVYAGGVKIADGVDYEVSSVNEKNAPATVEIINEQLYSAHITADYYVWKRNLKAEDILNALLTLAAWPEDKRKISPVFWQENIRVGFAPQTVLAVGYKRTADSFLYAGSEFFERVGCGRGARVLTLPEDFEINFNFGQSHSYHFEDGYYRLGVLDQQDPYSALTEGIAIHLRRKNRHGHSSDDVGYWIDIYKNGQRADGVGWDANAHVGGYPHVMIRKEGSRYDFNIDGRVVWSWTGVLNIPSNQINECAWHTGGESIGDYRLTKLGTDLSVSGHGFLVDATQNPIRLEAEISNADVKYTAQYNAGDGWKGMDLKTYLPITTPQAYFKITINTPVQNMQADFGNLTAFRLDNILVVNYVNLAQQSVLDVIKDLALITGYEFGADRENNFFFRPLIVGTKPVSVLDEKELVKIDTVQRDIKNLATKLTLNFAAIPLEFYANTGERPTTVDRYGVINREIDKPQLINYDNPELAQAIGPQLLAVYSTLPNTITCTGKLNLALELGDIVNLQREMPLTVPPELADYTKYERLNTFYLACKIIGLNYDFAKRQMKYTLRDVSNKNNAPEKEFYQYQTIFPTPLDYKE